MAEDSSYLNTFSFVCRFSFLAIIELGISVVGAVWAFIMAVVITAGVNVTCKGYRDHFELDDHVP